MKDFYITEIELHNYRRFENEVFRFDKNMNLLIGRNASGKTTVLEAVNVALGAYLAAYKTYVPSRFVRNISGNDVRRKKQRTEQKDVLLSTDIHVMLAQGLSWMKENFQNTGVFWKKREIALSLKRETIPCRNRW